MSRLLGVSCSLTSLGTFQALFSSATALIAPLPWHQFIAPLKGNFRNRRLKYMGGFILGTRRSNYVFSRTAGDCAVLNRSPLAAAG